MYLLMVVMARYTIQTFDTTDSIGGLVAGLFVIGSLLGRFMTGRFVDNVGPRKLLVVGSILLLITQALYFVEGSLMLLIIVRILNGMATAVVTTATGAVAGYLTPENRKGEGIAMFGLSLIVGAAIGPFFGLYLSEHYPMEVIFTLCIVIGVISFASVFFLNVEFPQAEQPVHATHQKFSIHKYFAVEAVPVGIVTLLIAVGYSSLLSFIQFFATENHFESISSYYFIVYAIAALVTRPIAGQLMDEYNENVVNIPAFISFALSLFLLGITQNPIAFFVSAILAGIGYGNLASTLQAVAVKVVPFHKIGLATATFFIGLDVGLGFGPFVLGMFTAKIGFANIYICMGVLLVLTLIFYYFVHGKRMKNIYGKQLSQH
ncbi:MFS transporter [Staphylococcus ursi]